MSRPPHVRRFLNGKPGIIESYEATWHGRSFPEEKLRARLDRFRDRCEIVGQVLKQDDKGDWQLGQTQVRLVTPSDWYSIMVSLEVGFWEQPTKVAGQGVFDGESWDIQGYRSGIFHSVYRDTGMFTVEVFEAGRHLFKIAGLRWIGEAHE